MNYFMPCLLVLTVTTAQKLDKRQIQIGYGPTGGSGGISGYPSAAALGGLGGAGGSGYSSSPSSSFGLYGANNVIPAQNPYVFSALDQIRSNEVLSATDVQSIVAGSYPGTSYPMYSHIPQTSFSCSSVRQFGFYADPETRCQVFRRCEANNFMFSYICPNGTVFNQVSLICDWWYNVNCGNAPAWADYANPRIYRQDLRLFDDPLNTIFGSGAAGGFGIGGDPSGGYGGGSNQFGALGGGGYGGSGAVGGGYPQGPSYRSSASTAYQVLTEPMASASEKTLREVLAQLAKAPPAAASPQTEASTTRKRQRKR